MHVVESECSVCDVVGEVAREASVDEHLLRTKRSLAGWESVTLDSNAPEEFTRGPRWRAARGSHPSLA